MTLKLVVEPAAEEDIRLAHHWYEDRQKGLGLKYLIVLDFTFSTILQNPKVFTEAMPGIRRAVTRTFPYLVFYACSTTSIHILAVIHAAQDPAFIAARLGA